jgi:DNA-binding MarR family transcriptional regulator
MGKLMNKQSIRQFRKTLRMFERLTDIQEKGCCRGIPLSQCHVLLEIEERGQATTGQLAKSLNLDKSTLSRTIDGLVNNGQLERQANPSDRRYIPLSLTKQGQATCDVINRLSDEYYARALERIPSAKMEQIIENFAMLVKAILDYESQIDAKSGCCTETIPIMGKANEQ